MADPLIVYVAALTFRRPATLRQLLDSFLELHLPSPEKVDVRFLIVDNDPEGSAQNLVESFYPGFGPGRLQYVIEAEPGIPLVEIVHWLWQPSMGLDCYVLLTMIRSQTLLG
jgi:hypothetical protein